MNQSYGEDRWESRKLLVLANTLVQQDRIRGRPLNDRPPDRGQPSAVPVPRLHPVRTFEPSGDHSARPTSLSYGPDALNGVALGPASQQSSEPESQGRSLVSPRLIQ